MEIVQRRELWIHTHSVTDCVRSVLEQIETALRHIIAPIPAKPTPVQTVTTESPRIVTPQEAL